MVGGGMQEGVGLEVGILQFMCEHDQLFRRLCVHVSLFLSVTLSLKSFHSFISFYNFPVFDFLLYSMRAA